MLDFYNLRINYITAFFKNQYIFLLFHEKKCATIIADIKGETYMPEFYLTPEDNAADILNNLTQPATIYLKKGIYRLKAEIRANNVTIVGEDRETTVITYDDYARKIHADGREYNTFRTYTLCITGEGVKLENLTVENSNTNPREVGQCVALSVNAKSFYAKNVDLKSTQDTLFLSPFPDDLIVRYRGFIPENQLYIEGGSVHLFENCKIYGTVDFIFGCAEAYFKGCKIISLNDGREYSYVAAPAHSLKQECGFVFYDCDFTGEGAADGSVYLARPWRDFGKCEFIDCRLDRHVNPLLYDKWNDTHRDTTARFAHFGLKNIAPSPVPWSRELTKEQADRILKNQAEIIMNFNK